MAIGTALTRIATGCRAARRAGIRGRSVGGPGAPCRPRQFSAVIAGLAVGVEPRIGTLAAAYVLILVVVGPLTARRTEPLARRPSRLSTASAQLVRVDAERVEPVHVNI